MYCFCRQLLCRTAQRKHFLNLVAYNTFRDKSTITEVFTEDISSLARAKTVTFMLLPKPVDEL